MRYAVAASVFVFTMSLNAAATAAPPADSDALPAKMFVETGDQYVAARAKLLEMPREVVLPDLLDRKNKAAWSDVSWQQDAIIDAAIVWVENPALARRMYALEGIDP